jgi:activator of HSP90 ATPase
MPKTIIQIVDFKAKPELLFALYADSKLHSEATGQHAEISKAPGGRCDAFEGSLNGTTLAVVRNRVFVQSWRAEDWTADQTDSVLTLVFEKTGTGGRVTMIHANIPEEHYAGIKTGWRTYYWTPWKKYIAGKARGRKK